MGEGRKYIDEAEQFLKKALKEFEEGEKNGDEKTIRNSAEKAWNAVLQATNALFEILGEPIPKSHFERRKGLEKLSVKYPQIEEKGFVDRYMAREQRLHENCFYEGIYEIPSLKGEFEKVKKYIEDVKGLK